MQYTFNEDGRLVRLAVIGLGGRGFGWVQALTEMKDVEIVAVCDVYPDRVDRAAQHVEENRGKRPVGYTDYHQLLCESDAEAVVVFTSWETHIRIGIDALKSGRRVGLEVGGACSMEECWEMVHVSEQTGIPLMLLENCCYGEDEMMVLNMLKKGLFGTPVHCQGGYEHDLRAEVGNGDINRHYRQNNFLNRCGELYPTHELGPIAKDLRINRGNRMVSLVSMSSKACGLHEWFVANRPDTPFATAQVNEGDIVTTMIKCAGGETIVLTRDCTLPRPYSRGGRVQGTKGLWMEDNKSIYLEPADAKFDPENPYPEHHWKSQEDYREQYEHPLWKAFKASEKTGGHGGMDYLVMRAFIESVQNHTLPPIDVYDAAAWLSVTVLSEQSIALGSMPVAVPDFTSGMWMHREPDCTDQYQLDCEPAEE